MLYKKLTKVIHTSHHFLRIDNIFNVFKAVNSQGTDVTFLLFYLIVTITTQFFSWSTFSGSWSLWPQNPYQQFSCKCSVGVSAVSHVYTVSWFIGSWFVHSSRRFLHVFTVTRSSPLKFLKVKIDKIMSLLLSFVQMHIQI